MLAVAIRQPSVYQQRVKNTVSLLPLQPRTLQFVTYGVKQRFTSDLRWSPSTRTITAKVRAPCCNLGNKNPTLNGDDDCDLITLEGDHCAMIDKDGRIALYKKNKECEWVEFTRIDPLKADLTNAEARSIAFGFIRAYKQMGGNLLVLNVAIAVAKYMPKGLCPYYVKLYVDNMRFLTARCAAFKAGDVIEVDGVEGAITEFLLDYTQVTGRDLIPVYIPNCNFDIKDVKLIPKAVAHAMHYEFSMETTTKTDLQSLWDGILDILSNEDSVTKCPFLPFCEQGDRDGLVVKFEIHCVINSTDPRFIAATKCSIRKKVSDLAVTHDAVCIGQVELV